MPPFALALAQSGLTGDIGHYAVVAVVLAGIIGILFIGLRAAGITLPAFVIQILWIVLAVFCCVLGIRFLLTM